MINIGRISYINVAPVYYGLDNGMRPSWMNLISAAPATLNNLLATGELDISPVSSAAYAQHQDEWLLLPGLSISCFRKVMSVILVSKYPFEKLTHKNVMLTEDSATAAALLRLLFALKGVTPLFETGKIRHARDIRKNIAAALVIGDAALKERWHNHFEYVQDLGEIWWELTGLPFVFALWAVRKSFAQERPDLVASVIEQFHISKNNGYQNMEKIIKRASMRLNLSYYICRKYYEILHYDLNLLQIKGLETFFEGLYKMNIISQQVHLSFFDEIYAETHAA